MVQYIINEAIIQHVLCPSIRHKSIDNENIILVTYIAIAIADSCDCLHESVSGIDCEA